MTESSLVTAICTYLDYKKVFFYRSNTTGIFDPNRGAFRKFPRYCRRGVPDIVAVVKGIYIGLEVKTGRGKQSTEQRRFQEDLEEVGGRYHLVRSLEDIEKLFT